MNYELKLPFQWKNHPVFHTTLLTPYHKTKKHGPNYIKLPLDLIDGQEEYEVEAILGHCFKGNTVEYLTAWKGYGSNDNTWEPEENLTNAEEVLEEYKKTHDTTRKKTKLPKFKLIPVSSHSSTRPSRCSTRSKRPLLRTRH